MTFRALLGASVSCSGMMFCTKGANWRLAQVCNPSTLEDCYKVEVSLGYVVNFRIAWVTV